ncbi:unnamed protein product [Merluccius merluccius]
MNGSVYISFFQGQLEPVLEQVVQLAVQEISKTVGSSLNSMLLETAVKEQENQRLKLQLQSRESGGGGGAGATDNGRPVPASKAGKADGGGASSGRTKLEPPPRDAHAPVRCAARVFPADTRRLEQKGRVVGQLKGVMERVLDFAVCELTKIVEASFDDLLLEITKKEREQKALEEYLGRSTPLGGGGGGPGERGNRGAGCRRGSEHDSTSPSGSEDTREEPADFVVSKETPEADDPDRPAVLSMSHDWVPILDKVFGQKWCSDVWQVKELEVVRGKAPGEGFSWRPGSVTAPFDLAPADMEPSPTLPQQDPRWTPLEDMEVLSPEDNNTVKGHDRAVSPAESLRRRSSASMLQRLLTLPAQLMEEDDDGGAGDASNSTSVNVADILDAVAPEGSRVSGGHDGELRGVSSLAAKQGEQQQWQQQVVAVEEEEEDKGRKVGTRGEKKTCYSRRVWLECDECGRRFSRASLLKTHRQTAHAATAATADERSSSPTGGEDERPSSLLTVLRCSECRKHFSSASRLQSHVQNHHQPSGKQS